MSRHSANEVSTVEVVNVVQRRRWAIGEKLWVIEESSLPSMSVSFVARKYGIAPNQVFRWRKLMSDGGKVAIQADDQVVSTAEAQTLKKRIRDLERLLGRKTMEVEILKEAIAIAREKTDLAFAVAVRGRFPMKRVAESLHVSRSRLTERLDGPPPARASRYEKEQDEDLPHHIRAIVDGRQTYGYRRVQARLNALLRSESRPPVNHKRVYRIMRMNGLLFTRHTGKRPDRPHEGKIITLHRNTRWCSDEFKVACDKRDVVRVAFVLDSCDREVISHVATTGGISGSMSRDLMLESVERRFGEAHTPHPVEWLSDNGSCYTAKETVEFASWVGLKSHFTPVRSPESNGMAEAFVKTFKRDTSVATSAPTPR